MKVSYIIKIMEATGNFKFDTRDIKNLKNLIFIDTKDGNSKVDINCDITFSELLKTIYRMAYDNGYNSK